MHFTYEFDIYDAIGLVGVACLVYCYGRVQWRRDFAKQFSYSILNLVASILVAVSLVPHWNLPSFTLNFIWGFFSIYGIYRCLKYKLKEKHKKA